MANITVSANVDTMLQAANNAAIRTAIGAGDVVGPASATDNAVVRYDGTTGKLVQDSGVTILDSGRVGIGDATPSYQLDVNGDAGINGDTYISAGTASRTAVAFANPVSSLCPELRMTRQGGSTSGNDFIKLDTSAGEVFSVDAAGGIDCDNILAGTGIAFGTDTAAANTLDDYEEGSWTPTVLFGGASVSVTYDAQVGRYTKIGNSVSASCFMDLSSKGSSTGSAVLGGLPFTSLNVASNHVATTLRLQSISFADVPMAYLTPNSTVVQLQESNNAGVVTTLTDGNFVDSSTVMVSVTYRV